MELALKPKAERNAAARGTALQEALENADALLKSRGSPASNLAGVEGADAGDGAEAQVCEALERLIAAARAQLQEEAAEQVRFGLHSPAGIAPNSSWWTRWKRGFHHNYGTKFALLIFLAELPC